MAGVGLNGKVAVVTGATGGWGSGAAVALAARGAAIVLNARTQSTLDEFAGRLTSQGATAIGVAQDIRTFEGASQLVASAVEAYGRIDALVNCAGVTTSDETAPTDSNEPAGSMPLYGGSLLNLSEASWSFVIETELMSVFNCCKAAATQMVAQGGGGSMTTVVGSILGAPGQSAHAAAKGAVLNGIWSWADELKAHRISVNGVRGYVRSLLTDPSFSIAGYDFDAEPSDQDLPTEPRQAGELVAWLASDDASDITGAYIGLDGPRITIWEPKLPETSMFSEDRWSVETLRRYVGPALRRRAARPSMTDVVIDLFSARDRERAAAQRAEFRGDKASDKA